MVLGERGNQTRTFFFPFHFSLRKSENEKEQQGRDVLKIAAQSGIEAHERSKPVALLVSRLQPVQKLEGKLTSATQNKQKGRGIICELEEYVKLQEKKSYLQHFRKAQVSPVSVIPSMMQLQLKDLLAAEEPLKTKHQNCSIFEHFKKALCDSLT